MKTAKFYPFEHRPTPDSCWSLSTGPEGRIYASSCCEGTPGGGVFIVRYNDEKDRLDTIVNVAEAVGEPLQSGRLWGTSGNAQPWLLDPARGEIERLPMRIPGAAGREQHTQVSAWVLDSLTGMLYGGTRPDGFLFKLEPETRQLVPLGKPCRQDLITCLAVGNDGRVFGMAGTSDDIGHSFCYDPATGSLVDLGIPVSTLAQRQYGYHYACALTGVDGEIYFGQHERVNFLWVYFPAVPRRAAG